MAGGKDLGEEEMNAKIKTKEKKMDNATLKSYLQSRGYRITPQRMAVLDAIIGDENKYLNATEIHAVAQKQYPGLGIATVYKNLRMLEREGLLNKLGLLDNAGRYEMNQDEAHCHLICIECGSISETREAFAQNVCDLLKQEDGFTVQKRALVFYGHCQHCLHLSQKQ